MTNQLICELLFAGWSGVDADNRAYTPWFPVNGDFASFGVEVVGGTGLTLTWNVETRTEQDPTATQLFTADNSVSSGVSAVTTRTAGGFGVAAKQWFRYRFSTGATALLTSWVMFRVLQPSWNQDR